ncbi:MAG: ROK family transcriptional regulator [Rhodothermaceae bacterium]
MKKVVKKNQIRRNLIMRALLDNKQLSLTDLKELTGISLPLVSSIVSQLEDENFVEGVADIKIVQAGRPPSIFKINGKAGYIIGIDLGRTSTSFIILDLELNLVLEERKKIQFLSNDIEVLDSLKKELDAILKENNINWKEVLSMGISIPGIVQGPQGRSETYLNFDGQNIVELLEEKFKKPVKIEHDIKAMTLGELNFGLAKNKKNVICVNIGYGLAAGLIIDGKLYYGSESFAGEFGHIQIDVNGPLCYCGKRGCLELYCSGKAIAARVKEKIKNGAVTIITSKKDFDIEKLDAKLIIENAKEGDQFCMEILEEAGKYLGYGLAQLVNVFNPELIIFGGRITDGEEFILNPVKIAAIKHSLVHLNRNIDFQITELGTSAGALGAARLAANEIFEVDHLDPASLI